MNIPEEAVEAAAEDRARQEMIEDIRSVRMPEDGDAATAIADRLRKLGYRNVGCLGASS